MSYRRTEADWADMEKRFHEFRELRVNEFRQHELEARKVGCFDLADHYREIVSLLTEPGITLQSYMKRSQVRGAFPVVLQQRQVLHGAQKEE